MKKIVKRIVQIIGFLLLINIIFVAGILILGTMNDFEPAAIIPLEAKQNATQKTISDSTLSFITWNIGFGGLGKESDFFLSTESIYWSSTKEIITDQKNIEKNVAGILEFMQKNVADFFLLQEVDANSKRSYFTDEFSEISQQKPGYASFFAANYNIPRNPIPFYQPWNTYGKVLSGLGTYSAYQPSESTRFQLPGDYGWPDKIFHLDRCASVHRFDTDFGKELIVLNIHNSAFDKGGFLKKQQMGFLKNMILEEFQKGNYIIMGGDWNMCPVGFPTNTFRPKEAANPKRNIDKDFMPEGWQWAFDPTVATIRSTAHPYEKDSTFISLIDFYLVSPNVSIEKIEGIDLNFEYSDHQPVRLEVKLGAE